MEKRPSNLPFEASLRRDEDCLEQIFPVSQGGNRKQILTAEMKKCITHRKPKGLSLLC